VNCKEDDFLEIVITLELNCDVVVMALCNLQIGYKHWGEILHHYLESCLLKITDKRIIPESAALVLTLALIIKESEILNLLCYVLIHT
jgi:hypothetical protein